MVAEQVSRGVGVFLEPELVEQALNQLKDSDFPMEKISVIAKQQEKVAEPDISDRVKKQPITAPTQIVADTLTASGLGAVLVGLTSLSLLGLGPILAAGSLGVALVTSVAGLGVGAIAANQLVKGLENLGIPETQARLYSDHLQRGNYLVLVEAKPDQVQETAAVFSQHGIQDWSIYPPAAAA